MYARRLTKEELIRDGITRVTEDGHVFRGDIEELPRQAKVSRYLLHEIYDVDENGKRIQIPNPKSVFGYNYKKRTLGLHRLMWAWFHDEVPEGMIVDHINNKHEHLEDYHLSNLQLFTPSENIRKERTASTQELKCKMDRPRSYYEDKLEQYLKKYDEAKLAQNAELVHKLRCNIYSVRARLRYWDSHKEEIENNIAIKEAGQKQTAFRSARTANIQKLRALAALARANGDKAMWHQFLGLVKNYDVLPIDQVEAVIKKHEEKI